MKQKQPKEHEEDQSYLSKVIEAIDEIEFDPDRHISIQIDSALREAVQAAQRSGLSASVKVEFKVKQGVDRRITFISAVSTKLPKPPVNSATMYADAAGSIHRSDPNQYKMPFESKPIPVTPFPTKDT